MSRAARKARRKHSTSALDDFAWKALDVTQVKKETFAYGGFMMLQTIPGSSVEVVRSASGLSMKAKKRPASSDPEAAAAAKGKKQRKANDGAAAAPAAAASASAAASQSGATAAPGKVVAMPPKSKKSKKKTLKAKAKASAAAGTAAADASSSSSSSSAAAVTAPSPGEVKAAADRKAAKKAKAKRKRKLNKKKKKAEVAAAKAAAAAAGQTVAVAPLDGSVDYGMWEGYGVSEFLLRALQRLGFGAPTTVQSMCLAAAIGGRKDIAAAAPTGSGKTLAFGLPVLHQLLAMPQLTAEEAKAAEVLPAKPPAIVIAPTRELAMQVAKHLRAVCVGSVLQRRGTIVTLVGGMADVKQKRLLSFNPQVVVATPGRLYDLLEAEAISLDHVKFAILDEADRLSLPNSFPSLPKIFEKITNGVEERQLFVFSATLTIDQPASRLLSMMSQLGMKIKSKKTTIVNLSQSGVAPGSTGAMGGESSSSSSSSSRSGGKGKGGGVGDGSAVRLPSTLALLQLRCVEAEKAAHLYYFYTQNPGRTLIFCNAISVVQQLTALLNLLNVPAFPLHGKMQQRQRLKNLDRFVSDTKGVLVATDVAARGLDVPHLDHVVHFHVPTEPATFVHRSGRTARAGRSGIALTLLAPVEIDRFRAICASLGADCDSQGRSSLMRFKTDRRRMQACAVRVDLAKEVQKMENTKSRAGAKRGWLEQMAKDCDLDVDDQYEEKATSEMKQEAQFKVKQTRRNLRRALAAPLR